MLLAMAFLFMCTNIFAQPRLGFWSDSVFNQGWGRYARNMLNLTEDQEKKIEELRAANQKEITDIRNDLAIKRAELQKLRSAENPDINQINKALDEIGRLNTEITKKNVALEYEILNLLTDEQKAYYQSRSRFAPFLFRERQFDMAPWGRGFERYPVLPFRGGVRPRGRF